MRFWPGEQKLRSGTLRMPKLPFLRHARIRTGEFRPFSEYRSPAGFQANAHLLSYTGDGQQYSTPERHTIPPSRHAQRRAPQPISVVAAKTRQHRNPATLGLVRFGRTRDISLPNKTSEPELCAHTRKNKDVPKNKTLAPPRLSRQLPPASTDLLIGLVAPRVLARFVRAEIWTKQSPSNCCEPIRII